MITWKRSLDLNDIMQINDLAVQEWKRNGDIIINDSILTAKEKADINKILLDLKYTKQ